MTGELWYPAYPLNSFTSTVSSILQRDLYEE